MPNRCRLVAQLLRLRTGVHIARICANVADSRDRPAAVYLRRPARTPSPRMPIMQAAIPVDEHRARGAHGDYDYDYSTITIHSTFKYRDRYIW